MKNVLNILIILKQQSGIFPNRKSDWLLRGFIRNAFLNCFQITLEFSIIQSNNFSFSLNNCLKVNLVIPYHHCH